MLSLVLADHVDSLTPHPLVAEWTLLGLGYSDASDVFVCLSGFVFGYVYGKRISEVGLQCWRGIARRTIAIYSFFLASALALGFINVGAGDLSWREQTSYWLQSSYLSWHDFNTAILALFVVLLPWTFILQLAIGQRSVLSMLSVSFAVYVVAQVSGPFLPSGWLFQPFAWQFLMIVASVLGQRYRAMGSRFIPTIGWLVAVAIIFLLASLLFKKFGADWIGRNGYVVMPSVLTSKSTWGPIRAIHHWSLMYVVSRGLPLNSRIWSVAFLRPLRICGRYPLTLYCIGVLVSRVGKVLLETIGSDDWTKMMFVIDALMIQFSVAFFVAWIRSPSDSLSRGVERDSV